MVGIVDKDYLNIDECVGRKVRLVELRNKGKNLSVELDSIFLGLRFGSATIGDGERKPYSFYATLVVGSRRGLDVVTCRGFLVSGLRKMCSVFTLKLLLVSFKTPTKLDLGGY